MGGTGSTLYWRRNTCPQSRWRTRVLWCHFRPAIFCQSVHLLRHSDLGIPSSLLPPIIWSCYRWSCQSCHLRWRLISVVKTRLATSWAGTNRGDCNDRASCSYRKLAGNSCTEIGEGLSLEMGSQKTRVAVGNAIVWPELLKYGDANV